MTKRMKSSIYPQDEVSFILGNYKGRSNKELYSMLQERFNTQTTEEQLKGFKSRNKLKSGLSGHFEPGLVPWNKGKKGYMGANATSFKKGLKPPNWKPIGSERVTVDGYVEVKVQDGHGNRNYKQKQRIVWEEHYGPVPDGYIVTFLDGDKTNFDINNLKLISRGANAIFNHEMERTDHRKINEALYNVAELKHSIGKKGRKKGE